MNFVPFNKPYLTGDETRFILEAHANGQLAGDGYFTKKCSKWLEDTLKVKRALMTHSCTAALEMAAILCDIKPGDEVIMPSYTFVSSANAFVMRGAIPKFVDIRPDTLNIDEGKIEEAITSKTKAILVVHYAGVSCEMTTICQIADAYNLILVKDAAQSIQSYYKGRPLGSIGDLGCISFHETKNIISGEGGALLINNENYIERAQIIREKGTNRSAFFQKKVDKYTWVDIGSSYLPGELICAFLWAQLINCEAITKSRISSWNKYYNVFSEISSKYNLILPKIPSNCSFNAHIFYAILPEKINRSQFIDLMKKECIGAIFHYVPLHSSPAGKKYGSTSGSLQYTDSLSSQIIRFPLWIGIEEYIQNCLESTVKSLDYIKSTTP